MIVKQKREKRHLIFFKWDFDALLFTTRSRTPMHTSSRTPLDDDAFYLFLQKQKILLPLLLLHKSPFPPRSLVQITSHFFLRTMDIILLFPPFSETRICA